MIYLVYTITLFNIVALDFGNVLTIQKFKSTNNHLLLSAFTQKSSFFVFYIFIVTFSIVTDMQILIIITFLSIFPSLTIHCLFVEVNINAKTTYWANIFSSSPVML